MSNIPWMENYSTDKFDKLCDVFFASKYIYIFIYWFIYLSLHSPEICPTSESNYSLSGWVWLVRFRNAKPVQSQLQKILTWSAYVLSEQPKAFFVSQNEIRAKPWALHIGLCSCDKIAFGESNCCEFGHGSKNGDWGPLWTHNFDKWLVAFGLWIWKRVFLLVSTCPSHDHLEPWIRKHSIIYIYSRCLMYEFVINMFYANIHLFNRYDCVYIYMYINICDYVCIICILHTCNGDYV